MATSVRVLVRLRPEVLDPAGQAVASALRDLGFAVDSARIGKVIDLSLPTDDRAEAEAAARRMAERLLANPVLEVYAVEVEP
jgi:phosphoribosylformylglycinamidine synthase PurS subunit